MSRSLLVPSWKLPHRTALVLAVVLVSCTPVNAEEASILLTPDLQVVGWTVVDDADGNGDAGLHPGETVQLIVLLSNRGSEPATDVTATLFEVGDHPDIEILQKFDQWPALPAAGTSVAGGGFTIRAAATRPCSWEIALRLQITAAGGYSVDSPITLVMIDPRKSDIGRGEARPFYYGADASDLLGSSVAACDIDGDGYGDLILGAVSVDGASGFLPGAGEARVVYGSASRGPDIDLASSHAHIGTVFGGIAEAGLGNAAACGDLNGDGFDDVVLAASLGDALSFTRPLAGEVYVIYGDPVRIAAIHLVTAPPEVIRIFGAGSGDEWGTSLTTGDLNGDGYDEIVIGARRADGVGDGREDSGEVAVVYGGPSRLNDIDLAAPPSNVSLIRGAAAADELGTAVAAGDLDGDGRDELLLGAPLSASLADERAAAGEVAILAGSPDRLPATDLAVPTAQVRFVFGRDPGDRLGTSLASGDLDGDGNHEALVGAIGGDGPDNSRVDCGEAAILHGMSWSAAPIDLAARSADASILFGRDAGDGYGAALATGDRNGDGFAEAMIGASHAAGLANDIDVAAEIAVLPGRPQRQASLDLANAPADVEFIAGPGTPEILGNSPLALATGDLDGDGLDELLVGLPFGSAPPDRFLGGRAAVLPGEPRSRYRWDNDGYAFIDATVGVDTGIDCDDCSVEIPIGFSFDFYGESHDRVTVSSNGYLTFGPNGDQPVGFCPPASNPANAVIAAFWDDLNPAAGGGVFYLLEGTAPGRRLTVEWAGVPYFPAEGAATFEVTLFESSNQILFQYDDVTFGNAADHGGTAIVGVENATGTNGTAFSCSSASVAELTSLRWRRFASPTIVDRDDVETEPSNWEVFAGIWQRASEPDCTPTARSGERSWYFGQPGSCDYDTGSTPSGTLLSQPFVSLPQDARLSFWQRRMTEGNGGVDTSLIQKRVGVPITLVRDVTENSGRWLHTDDFLPVDTTTGIFQPIDLSDVAGQDVEIGRRPSSRPAVLNHSAANARS